MMHSMYNGGRLNQGYKWNDIGYAILIYLGINAVRFVTVGIFYPLLARLGTGFDWKIMLVVVWGGLRGSVGLALALVVHHTHYHTFWGAGYEDPPSSFEESKSRMEDLPCRDIPTKIQMITCWIVFLTVVVNGSTVARLIALLRLDELSDDRKFMLNRALKKLKSETAVMLGGMKTIYENVDWAQVRHLHTPSRPLLLAPSSPQPRPALRLLAPFHPLSTHACVAGARQVYVRHRDRRHAHRRRRGSRSDASAQHGAHVVPRAVREGRGLGEAAAVLSLFTSTLQRPRPTHATRRPMTSPTPARSRT